MKRTPRNVSFSAVEPYDKVRLRPCGSVTFSKAPAASRVSETNSPVGATIWVSFFCASKNSRRPSGQTQTYSSPRGVGLTRTLPRAGSAVAHSDGFFASREKMIRVPSAWTICTVFFTTYSAVS